jgi:hypothetical protein
MKYDKDWKKFEHLTTALHKSESKGAKVTWNEIINGRQFDVTIRFKTGYYDYLTVIECRDQSSSIPIGEVEAFVTKSMDAKADKAVMISSSGFQSGAIKVAYDHKIELFTLTEINELPHELLSNKLSPHLNIYSIKFKLKDSNEWVELPEDKNLPEYLLTHLLIKNNDKDIKLYEQLNKLSPTILTLANSSEQTWLETLPKNTTIYFPHLVESYLCDELSFNYKIITLKTLIKHTSLDPFFEKYSYKFTNVLTGEEKKIKKLELKYEFDTILQPGHFYFNPEFEFSYYCHSIQGKTVKMSIIESYQHGELMQFDIEVSLEFGKQLIEITDSVEIERLKKVGRGVFEHNRVKFG